MKNVKHPPLPQYLEELVLKHIGLCNSIALKRYKTAPHALDLEELKSIAYIGLMEAAQRWPTYCDERGFDDQAIQFFTTYASRRCFGAIEDHIRTVDWATRSLREKAKKLREVGADEGLSRQELSDRSGMALDEIHKTIAGMSRAPISLESLDPSKLDADTKTAHRPELTAQVNIEADVATRELLDSFGDAVLDLDPEAQVVVALHYYRGLELKKIAALLDISEAVTSQIHTRAVLALLDSLKEAAQND